jgi:hypothetical protein
MLAADLRWSPLRSRLPIRDMRMYVNLDAASEYGVIYSAASLCKLPCPAKPQIDQAPLR